MAYLNLQYTSKNIDKNSANFTCNYTLTNGAELITAIPNQNWIDVTIEDDYIDITVDENTSSENRSGVITLKYQYVLEGTGKVKFGYETITLNQSNSSSASTASITLAQSSIEVPNTNNTTEVSLTATSVTNIVANTDNAWITARIESNKLLVTVEANSGNTRQGTVSVVGLSTDGTSHSATLNVSQASSTSSPKIILSKDSEDCEYTASTSAKTMTYAVSNCSVTAVTSSESWLTISSFTDSGFTYQFAANQYNLERKAYVIVKATPTLGGNDITAQILFTQAANPNAQESLAYVDFPNGSEYTSPFMGNTLQIQFYGTNLDGSYGFETDSEWMSGIHMAGIRHIDDSHISGYLIVPVAENTDYEERIGIIKGTFYDSSNMPFVCEIVVTQSAKMEVIEAPIWKDTDIRYPYNGLYMDYTIEVNDVAIYSGRAYAVDGYVTIRVNDILKDYVYSNVDLNVDKFQNSEGYIQADIMSGKKQIAMVNTYANWSYDENEDHRLILNEPISYNVDSRQLIPMSVAAYDGESVTVKESYRIKIRPVTGEITPIGPRRVGMKDGVNTTVIEADAINTMTYSQTVSEGFYTEFCKALVGDLQFTVGSDKVKYIGDNTCYDWCLYYLNSYGGYDSLLVKGKQLEKKSITSNTFKRTSQNATLRHQVVNYQKDIKLQWDMSTDYLSDKNSKILYKHLYDSPQIWLHNLSDDKIYPVNITNSSVDCKTFRNQGRKMFTHSFTLELSQDRIRK